MERRKDIWIGEKEEKGRDCRGEREKGLESMRRKRIGEKDRNRDWREGRKYVVRKGLGIGEKE